MSTAPIAAGDVEKPVPSLRAMPAAQALSKQPLNIIQSREVSLFLREDPGALADGREPEQQRAAAAGEQHTLLCASFARSHTIRVMH
jgi:hypothetical protein